MKIKVLAIAKTEETYLKTGMDIYCSKLPHYFPFEYIECPAVKQTKNMTKEQQKEKEGEVLLSKITNTDTVVLLDECGKMFTSVGFSDFLQQQMNLSRKQLIFVIGGPYGFSQKLYNRLDYKISLSPMTFSHQMVRLIFLEQLYRAASILQNEPYHHQ